MSKEFSIQNIKKMGREEKDIRRIKVTPEMAQFYLDNRNARNRNIGPKAVKYAELMAEGRWNPEVVDPVELSKEGWLLDGQHRFKAIVLCGIPQWLMVKFNVPESTRDWTNTGRSRSVSDILRMQHSEVEMPAKVSSAAYLVKMLERRTNSKIILDAQQVAEMYQDRKEAFDSINEELGPIKNITQAPIRGALIFAHKKFPEETEGFVLKLKTGANLQEGEGALMLRNYIFSGHREGISRLENKNLAMKTLAALKHHVEADIGLKRIYSPSSRDGQDKLISYFD